MTDKTDKGIFFEITPALGHWVHKYYHAYLVYRDGEGKAEVIRGGPTFLGVGSIEIESGVSLNESDDAYDPGETMDSRHARKLDLDGRDPATVWSGMKKKAEEIGNGEIDYDLMPDQNSNSVVRSVLDSVDIPLEKAIPPKFNKGDLPGIENDLSKHLSLDKEKKPGMEKEEDLSVPKDMTKEVPGRQGALSGPADPGIDAFLAELKKPLDAEDEFLLKPVAQISGNEIKRVMAGESYHNGGDARRGDLLDKAGAWHDHFYGTGPVKRDATGRQITPRPVRQIPKASAPVGDARGGDVAKGVLDIGSQMAGMAGREGIADAIRILQSGLNKLPRTTPPINDQPEISRREETIFSTVPLREAGLFGPKTKRRLFESITAYGPRRIGQAFPANPLARTG